MKNKKLFLIIYISLLIVMFISMTVLSILGKKERIGYLSDFEINVDNTLEINGLDKEETKQLFTIDDELDESAINHYILTNESITTYSYDFKMRYYDKVFRNSDIYGVYPILNNLPDSVQSAKMNDDKGTPFGNLISYKIIDFGKIDNVNYILKLKDSLILKYIVLLVILLLCVKDKIIGFKISFIIITIIIVSMILLSFLGKKDRMGYLSDFKININNTLEINGLDKEETKQLFIINDKLDESAIKHYILTNESITMYNYDFRVRCYSKVFRDSNIYEVYPYLNNLPEYIKSAEINDKFGTTFGSLISDKELKYDDKIDTKYYLMINLDIFYYITFISIIVLLYVGFYLLKEYWKYKKTLDEKDYLFVKKIELITIILIIFRIWLFYPGVYYDFDNINSILRALFAYSSNNWHPVITELSFKLMSKFNLTLGTFFIINTLLLYGSIFLIVNVLYLKYKHRFVVILFSIPFIPQIFFYSNEISKDSNATLYVIFSYAIVFFIIISELKDKKIKTILKVISLISLIIGMLHRHNFIVTVYPILIWFTYDYLKTKNIKSIKKYLFYFASIMFLNAIILMGIYIIFPRIFIKDISKITSYHIYYLQIAGCVVPSNDSNLIPQSWYLENKNFEDVIKQYNEDKLLADPFITIFNRKFDPKKVWIKSILKYPYNYIKHMFNYTKSMWTLYYKFPSYFNIDYNSLYDFLLDRYIFSNYPNIVIDENEKSKFYYENDGIKVTDLKKDVYNFVYDSLYLININVLIFILLSFIIFIISFIFLLKKEFRNSILIFTFSVSFSASATSIIVAAFTPVVHLYQYRYVYPVISISMISLIGFITFIYDRGGVKKIIKELRGNK